MLQIKAVEPNTLSLLKELMLIPELNNFCLVGGTALALKFGHRISVDLDLFSDKAPDFKLVHLTLKKHFGEKYRYEELKINFAHFCYIDNIKVDLVHYPYSQIKETEIITGIRMYSNIDIAAMKINAIPGRGVKKDFYDLARLLQEFSLKEIIDFHKEKYQEQMLLISIPNALVYFEDADLSNDPISLINSSWENVKKIICNGVRDYFD